MPEPQFDLEGRVGEAMNEVLFLKQAFYGMRELAEDQATCPNEFDPCISQVDRVADSLVDVFEHLPAKAIEPGPDSARAGAPVAGAPDFSSVGLSDAATPGMDLCDEVEDLGNDLYVIHRVLIGMQADAVMSVTKASDFDSSIIFMGKIQDQVEEISGALGRLIFPTRLDQGSVAKARPGQKGKEPAADRRAPAAKGNGREARTARA